MSDLMVRIVAVLLLFYGTTMKNGNGSLDCESSMYKDSQPSWYLVLTKTACPVTYEGATTASAIESFTIGEHTRADNGTKAK
ncbi:hypothetical protein V6N13_140470 [Hibiscus sabdariffa]